VSNNAGGECPCLGPVLGESGMDEKKKGDISLTNNYNGSKRVLMEGGRAQEKSCFPPYVKDTPTGTRNITTLRTRHNAFFLGTGGSS